MRGGSGRVRVDTEPAEERGKEQEKIKWSGEK